MFNKLLTATGEELLQLLYKSKSNIGKKNPTARDFARDLQLTSAQFTCALGFNDEIESLPDVVAISGFDDYQNLADIRNEYFMTDIYNRLGIRDVLSIYTHVAKNQNN